MCDDTSVTIEGKLAEIIERYFRVSPPEAARSDAESIIRELEHFGFKIGKVVRSGA